MQILPTLAPPGVMLPHAMPHSLALCCSAQTCGLCTASCAPLQGRVQSGTGCGTPASVDCWGLANAAIAPPSRTDARAAQPHSKHLHDHQQLQARGMRARGVDGLRPFLGPQPATNRRGCVKHSQEVDGSGTGRVAEPLDSSLLLTACIQLRMTWCRAVRTRRNGGP